MSIGLIAQDLVTQVKTVAALSNRVGLAVGGQEIDPINRDLPRPAAWCVYVGDDVVESSPLNPCNQLIQINFVIKVLVDYDNESNLIDAHFPLLHNIVDAVKGNEPIPGSKWSYDGQGLESLESDRMVWSQQYSILIGI